MLRHVHVYILSTRKVYYERLLYVTIYKSHRLSVFFMLHRWCHYTSSLRKKEIQIRGLILVEFLKCVNLNGFASSILSVHHTIYFIIVETYFNYKILLNFLKEQS